ncbi:unnamed protein product [Discosporangium mesarthrocarpum]
MTLLERQEHGHPGLILGALTVDQRGGGGAGSGRGSVSRGVSWAWGPVLAPSEERQIGGHEWVRMGTGKGLLAGACTV